MKVKTALFGAGAGARMFMSNTENERDFVAIFDNDERKHGQMLGSLQIASLDTWATVDFDEIVITTQWAKDVLEQLLALGIPATQVIIPAKYLLKGPLPFEDETTRLFARQVVKELSTQAHKQHCKLMIDFGTLLGIVRDGDIIPWDDDIDFSVDKEDAESLLCVLRAFIKETGLTQVIWGLQALMVQEKVVGYLLNFENTADSEIRNFTTSFCFREISDGYSCHMPSLGMWYAPVAHFQSVEQLEWQGVKLNVPSSTKDYLIFVYGENWGTPKKHTQLSDYSHLKTIDFQLIKECLPTTHDLV